MEIGSCYNSGLPRQAWLFHLFQPIAACALPLKPPLTAPPFHWPIADPASRPPCVYSHVGVSSQRIGFVHFPFGAGGDVSNLPGSGLTFFVFFYPYNLIPDSDLSLSGIYSCSLSYIMRPSVSQGLSSHL